MCIRLSLIIGLAAGGLMLLPACADHQRDRSPEESHPPVGTERPAGAQLDQQDELPRLNQAAENQASGNDTAQPAAGDRPAQAQPEQEQPQQEQQRDEWAEVAAAHETVEQRVAGNIHGTLATITEAALTRSQFRSVVQRLSDRDRDRMGDFADREFPDLDARIVRFQEDWQARYGQDFNIEQRELVYNRDVVRIVRGWTEEAQLARLEQTGELRQRHDEMREGMERQREATDRPQEAQPEPQGNGDAQQQEQQADRTGETQQAANADEDERDRATVLIPSFRDLPAMAIPMVNEGTLMDAWRIDVPDQVDGPRLQQNLLRELKAANDRKDQWPADVNEAYRMVTHHVLMAVMDVQAEQEDRQQDEQTDEARTAGAETPPREQPRAD